MMDIDKVKTTTVGESQIDLLGTAHVSKISQETVRQLLMEGDYTAVAVELCNRRLEAITNPDAMAQTDLWQIIRRGKAMAITAMLALGAYQQRIAEQFNIDAGAEIKTAVYLANDKNLPLTVIDRDIGTTLKRLYKATPWWQRMGMISTLLFQMLNRQHIDENEIERIKQSDMLESMLKEMEMAGGKIKHIILDERDQYMAAKILEYVRTESPKKMLVVIGAGHLMGIHKLLLEPIVNTDEHIKKLEYIPPTSRIWKFVPWIIVVTILTGFIIGFQRGSEFGMGLVYYWILINGGLAALGAILATAHPLTVVTAFVAAPLTSINPTIGAGMVTAFAEMFLRKPKVADFHNLRKDVTTFKGWRTNNAARVLLIFVFSTIGSAIGTYIGGAHILQQIL